MQEVIAETIKATADAAARHFESQNATGLEIVKLQVADSAAARKEILEAIAGLAAALVPMIADIAEKDRKASSEREKIRLESEIESKKLELKIQEEKTRTAEAAAGKFNK